jgi:cytochrome c oxidase subunit IV
MADSHAIHDHSHSHGGPAHSHEHGAGHHEGEHHGTHWKQYALIGVILAIITGVEVAIFYIEALAPVLIPLLLVLSAAKFILVVLYYMHLKIDHAIFGRVFWGPLFLAVLVVVGMVILFKVLPAYGVFS